MTRPTKWARCPADNDWVARAEARTPVVYAIEPGRDLPVTLIGWTRRRARIQYVNGNQATVDNALISLIPVQKGS